MAIDSDLTLGVVMGGSLLLILILVVIGKYRGERDDVEQDETSHSPATGSERSSRAVLILSVLVVLLFATAGGLTYALWDLRTDFDASKADLVRAVDEAEARLTVITEEAVEKVPDVDGVQRDVDTLEKALFGISGAPVGANDELGEMRKDLADAATLMREFSGLNNAYATKSCVNSGFQSLQNYAERIAGYAAIIASGGMTVRPYSPNPRCY